MSTNGSKSNSSQAKAQSGKPGNSTVPQAKRNPGNRKPLPFDDDDNGTTGDATETTNPPIPKIDDLERGY